MKNNLAFIIMLILVLCSRKNTQQEKQSSETESKELGIEETFADCIKKDNIDKLKTIVNYPLAKRNLFQALRMNLSLKNDMMNFLIII